MPIHVLLIDEDRDVLEVTEAFLGREDGITVSTERDPERAIERVGDEGVDAVVTDLTMPKLDGLAVAEEIQERHDDVPVFVFTGSDPSTIECEEGLVQGFVQKGAGTEQYGNLAARIREAV